MGTVVKGLFKNRWHPQIQFVRCKTKVNVTRPRLPFYGRALMENACKPIIREQFESLPKYMPNVTACDALAIKPKTQISHPLKTILAKEDLELFKTNKMIAFFHLNPQTEEEKFQCQLQLKKSGMKFSVKDIVILEEALTNTIYEPILKLYEAPTAIAYCVEPDISKLLSIHKKLPKVILMGALIENRLLSLTELQYFGQINDITAARSMLLSTLNSAAQNLLNKMTYHPSNLVALLNQHKKVLEEKGVNNMKNRSSSISRSARQSRQCFCGV